jgi:hypothetical protein
MDTALNDQREILFQAMAIIRLAAITAQRVGSPVDGSLNVEGAADVWSALNGAYALLDGVAGKLQDSGTILAKK